MHLVDLVKAVIEGPNGRDTLIIVTYDEFGGQWDHMPPPPFGRVERDDEGEWGRGHGKPRGPSDQWGPGSRVPALLISKKFRSSGVDRNDHDTTSILKLIEERFHLAPLGTRDAQVISLRTALEEGGR